MDPRKINIKNVKGYQMTVKYDKKLINRTVFAKTYNEPILSNIQKVDFWSKNQQKWRKSAK